MLACTSGQTIQNLQHIPRARLLQRQIINNNQSLIGNFIRQNRTNCQATHFLRNIMMVRMGSRTKYNTAMTELRCTRTTLTSVTCSFLSIGLLITARNLTASLRRSSSLATIHQLCSNNLMENRHIRSDSEHLLAQLELLQGLP